MIDWKNLVASHDTQAELVMMVNAMLGEEIENSIPRAGDIHTAIDDAIAEVRFQLKGMGAPADFLTQYDLQYGAAREELADIYLAHMASKAAGQ